MDVTQKCDQCEPEDIVQLVRLALLDEGIDTRALGLSDNTLLVMVEPHFRDNETIEAASNGLYRHVKTRLAARERNQVMDDDPMGAKLRHERNIARYRRFRDAKLALAAELKAAVEATKDGGPRMQPPTISRAALEAAAAKAGLAVGGES